VGATVNTVFDHQVPEACEDELASAFQFINGIAYKYGIDPIDVQTIARSDSFHDLRSIDTGILIDTSVRAYNCTSILVAFGEAVGVAMREWEESRRMPIMGIWCSHPTNFDSLRTYVWAQKQFRLKVEVVAHRRLSEVSPIGAYIDAKPDSASFSLKPTPVEELIAWISCEYKNHLGIFPIPG
jgi:hypothetical protein